MTLSVNGSVLRIGQLGPDFLILRNPIEHPPSDAEIMVSIDGHERRWTIRLPDGISVASDLTRIALCSRAS